MHTDIRTESILENQVHAGHRLVRAWFKRESKMNRSPSLSLDRYASQQWTSYLQCLCLLHSMLFPCTIVASEPDCYAKYIIVKCIYTYIHTELEISRPLAIFWPIFPIWPSKSNLLGQIYCTFPMGKPLIAYCNVPALRNGQPISNCFFKLWRIKHHYQFWSYHIWR